MNILFKTNLRRKLLTFSFTHPDEPFYVREMASFIHADPGNVSRELRNFETAGLYMSQTKGREKFYSLNKKYPLIKEMKEIIFKTEGVEGGLRAIFSKFEGISFACIHGSFAKSRENAASDVDLIIVGSFSAERLTRELKELEIKLNRDINFTSYSGDEFYKERKKKGSFLNLVLAGATITLKGEPDGK